MGCQKNPHFHVLAPWIWFPAPERESELNFSNLWCKYDMFYHTFWGPEPLPSSFCIFCNIPVFDDPGIPRARFLSSRGAIFESPEPPGRASGRLREPPVSDTQRHFATWQPQFSDTSRHFATSQPYFQTKGAGGMRAKPFRSNNA